MNTIQLLAGLLGYIVAGRLVHAPAPGPAA
jgi:hypothetical protein